MNKYQNIFNRALIAGFIIVSAALMACSGGGGNAGTSGSGSGSGGTGGSTTTAAPSLTLTLIDSNGNEVTTKEISQSGGFKIKAVLKTATAAAVTYERVAVVLDNTSAKLVPVSGTQLTDVTGIALLPISPADVSSAGVVGVTGTALVNGVSVSATLNVNIKSGTVAFATSPVLSPAAAPPALLPTVQKGQSLNVTVGVTINGAAALSNSVAVSFSTNCGTVSPATALVDNTGKATAVIQTTASGNACIVSASAGGVTSGSATYAVTSPPVSSIAFISASPTLIYQQDSPGVTTSQVKFKVLDTLGAGISGQQVNATLSNLDGGINFCPGLTGANTASGVTNGAGEITFQVCAGTLPATVQVKASLPPVAPATASTIFTSSNLLTVQTGLPSQAFFDIAATKLNFYAGGYFTSRYNGDSVDITVSAADRQGNPVPNGTPVTLVTEGGQINSSNNSSCLINNGACSVKLIGQDFRPFGSNSTLLSDSRPGRVTVLAMADGEETFTDTLIGGVYNNRWDPGEYFEDLGEPFMDKDEDGVQTSYNSLVAGTPVTEPSYPIPTAAKGTASCSNNIAQQGLSVANTCNGTWDRYTKVRRKITIAFSGGEIGQDKTEWFKADGMSYNPPEYIARCRNSAGGLGYDITIAPRYRTKFYTNGALISDCNGNPLPAGTTFTVSAEPDTCVATLTGGSPLLSTNEPQYISYKLVGCARGNEITIKATVPYSGGTLTSTAQFQYP